MTAPARLIDNSYWLEECLGQGGMASVFRATSRLTGEVVALKLVAGDRLDPQSDTTSSKFRLRLALLREFQTLSSLHHPNIVAVRSYGMDSGRDPYFTMELLEDAKDIVKAAEAQPLRAKLDLLAQLLRAIAYVHRRGILHRDLKPSEVGAEAQQAKKRELGPQSLRPGLPPPNQVEALAPKGQPLSKRSWTRGAIDSRAADEASLRASTAPGAEKSAAGTAGRKKRGRLRPWRSSLSVPFCCSQGCPRRSNEPGALQQMAAPWTLSTCGSV